MISKKKVLLVIGPQMFREFLRSLLEEEINLEVVDEVFDGIEAVEAVKKHEPDLLLLDLFLPRLSGVSVLNSVRNEFPYMKVMVLTDYKSDQHVVDAFEAGANGYCIKDTSRDEMMMAVRSIMAGQKFVCTGIAEEVVEGYLEGRKKIKEDADWEIITQREREVLKLLAEGFKNREIGEMLHISVKTVEKHRSNIMNKLGLRNVASLTAFAMEHGLVNGAGGPFTGFNVSSSGLADKSDNVARTVSPG